jgi:hypothetical protein
MRPRLIVSLLAAAVLCASSIIAQVDLKFSGSMRYREEVQKLGFRQSRGVTEYAQLRTRFAVDALIDSLARIYIQVQDSRTIGGTDTDARLVSGTLRPKNNVDLHQAFVEFPHLGGTSAFVKAGRFEVSAGNGRVFGVEDYHYVGRAWEGAQVGVAKDEYVFSLSRLRLFEQSTYSCGGTDADLWLAILSPGPDLQGFISYEYEVGSVTAAVDRIRRFSAGFYARGDQANFVAQTNVAMQFGHQPALDQGYFEKNIAAYLFTAEIGYQTPNDSAIYLGFGLDWSSGDDPGTTRTYEAFEAEYYSARDFRGAMGYFTYNSPPYTMGLMDMYIKSEIKFSRSIEGSLSLHRFKTDKDYADELSNKNTNEVGWELDGSATAYLGPRVYMEFDSGLFMPAEEFARLRNPSKGWWLSGAMGASF